jgi:Uma2 family endonuclease
MQERIDDEIMYHYDFYPSEEDLMGETAAHSDLIEYLTLVLRWLFRGYTCAIHKNLNFYQTPDPYEKPLAPDLAVIKGVPYRRLRSWRIGKHGPAPHVVFEALSAETWEKDLNEKPARYAQMDVQEYFAYDPHEPPLAQDTAQRLFGWRRDDASGLMYPLRAGHDERLWSAQLDSWLVPDGPYLLLYDVHGNLRLTEAQAFAEKLRSLGVDPDQI